MDDTMASGSSFLQTVVAALTLRDEAFRAAGNAPNPVRRGLAFVAGIGFVVALASLVGAALTWWTSPNMAALKQAISDGIMDMPWQKQVPPEALEDVRRAMEMNLSIVWQILDNVLPSVPKALANLVWQPLGMVVFWLVFGLVGYACARLFAGSGTLPQTYGATALAAAPALLGVVHLLPNVQSAGLTTWSLICWYLAIKNVHGLSPGRAFWATILPMFLVVVMAGLVGAVVGTALALGGMALGGLAR